MTVRKPCCIAHHSPTSSDQFGWVLYFNYSVQQRVHPRRGERRIPDEGSTLEGLLRLDATQLRVKAQLFLLLLGGERPALHHINLRSNAHFQPFMFWRCLHVIRA